MRFKFLAISMLMVGSAASAATQVPARAAAASPRSANKNNAVPAPAKGPAPAWVERVAAPALNPDHKGSPLQIQLVDGQTLFGTDRTATYIESVVTPQTMAGLQAVGTIAWPWDPSRTKLTFNRIEIRRGSETIDLLREARFRVLEREANLDQARFDGVRTVVMPAPGLQIGDQLVVAMTYETIPGTAIGPDESISNWYGRANIVLAHSRFIVPDGKTMRWRNSPTVPNPVISKSPLGTEYRVTRRHVAEAVFPSSLRDRDKLADMQFTAYSSWEEVANPHVLLYQAARKTAAGSPLMVEADKIAAATADPHKRMMAALRLTQEQVRYVALLLGDGAYQPAAADATWTSKYGDCKAKSAMLLALLDRFQIKAEPMMVRSSGGDILIERLPSLASFDHVIVRAEIAGTQYFLDATDYGQRTLDEVRGSPLFYALPMIAKATLQKLPRVPISEPGIETELVWDGTAGLTGDVPYTGTLILRGATATLARAKLASAETTDKFEDYLKNMIPRIPNESITLATKTDDQATGNYVATYKGTRSLGWQTYSDVPGYRFGFDNNAAKWEPDFDREKGAFKDSPVQLNDTFWQREIETLILPDPKGFTIDAKPIDSTIAGAHITRVVKMAGNRVTAVTEFRHTRESVPAQEARDAVPLLKAVRDQWADVVAPRSFKLPRETRSK